MYFYKQVKFSEELTGEKDIFGGIAAYDGDKLKFVICGECGGVFEPEDIEILKEYDTWVDLTEAIVGDDHEWDDDDGIKTIVETEPWRPSQFRLNS